jgi:hypothetical protein
MNLGVRSGGQKQRLCGPLPCVQERSGQKTIRLEMVHFVGAKYVDVHQSSPALGSRVGSDVHLVFRVPATMTLTS